MENGRIEVFLIKFHVFQRLHHANHLFDLGEWRLVNQLKKLTGSICSEKKNYYKQQQKPCVFYIAQTWGDTHTADKPSCVCVQSIRISFYSGSNQRTIRYALPQYFHKQLLWFYIDIWYGRMGLTATDSAQICCCFNFSVSFSHFSHSKTTSYIMIIMAVKRCLHLTHFITIIKIYSYCDMTTHIRAN